ncbi:hypothetical protein HK102_009913, partial [Quaeritorhiza haematococci]
MNTEFRPIYPFGAVNLLSDDAFYLAVVFLLSIWQMVLACGQLIKRSSNNGFSIRKPMDLVLLWHVVSTIIQFALRFVDVSRDHHLGDMLHLPDLVVLPGVSTVALTLSTISSGSSKGKAVQASKIRAKVLTILCISSALLLCIPLTETIISEEPPLASVATDSTVAILALALVDNAISIIISLGTALLLWKDFFARRRIAADAGPNADPVRRRLNGHLNTMCITFTVGIVVAMGSKLHLDLFHIHGVTWNIDGFLYNISSGFILATVINVFIAYNFGENGFEFLRPKVTVVVNTEGKAPIEVVCVRPVSAGRRPSASALNGSALQEQPSTAPSTGKVSTVDSSAHHGENVVNQEVERLSKTLKFSYEEQLWWKDKNLSFRSFFSFPDVINVVDSRGQAICSWCLVATALIIDFIYGFPYLYFIPLTFFILRVISGLKIDPQSLFVLFVLRPYFLKPVLRMEDDFVPGLPRWTSQVVGSIWLIVLIVLRMLGVVPWIVSAWLAGVFLAIVL